MSAHSLPLAARRLVPEARGAPGSLRLVAIPTRGRPSSLDACIGSHRDTACRFGRELAFLVVDDGEGEVRGVVRAWRRVGVSVDYAGTREREAFVRALVRSGAPVGPARAALLRAADAKLTTGAARNAILLATAGRCFVASDDDMRAEAVGDRWSADAQASDERDPTETWFFRGPAELPEPCSELDVFREYESALRTPDVACAVAGVRGGAGMGTPAVRLLVPAASRARLHSEPDVYAEKSRSDVVVRRATRPTLARSPFGMGGHIALDNRGEIPLAPFAPSDANEDGVFFAVNRRLFPNVATAVLPLAVGHTGIKPLARDAMIDGVTHVRANDFLAAMISSLPIPGKAEAHADRLTLLGDALARFALSNELADRAVAWRKKSCEMLVVRADTALDEAAEPPKQWVRDVRDLRARLVEARDAASTRTLPLAAFSERIASYATIVGAWPVLRAAAARLARAGVHLGGEP